MHSWGSWLVVQIVRDGVQIITGAVVNNNMETVAGAVLSLGMVVADVNS